MDVETFISNWTNAPVTERSHFHSFIFQLCYVIGVELPDQHQPGSDDYRFERPVAFRHDDGSMHWGYIDCYRRNCFVLEAKQSAKAVTRKPDVKAVRPHMKASASNGSLTVAKNQAENYAKALDEWPPFLITTSVGASLELWSDFARMGKGYVQFPDRDRHRIQLEDLRDPAVRERLRRVWEDPMSLDPALQVAKVTADMADLLAQVVRSIHARGPRAVDGSVDAVNKEGWEKKTTLFLIQCLFAMFADSVGLIENRAFRQLLHDHRVAPGQFHKAAGQLFQAMDRGGYCQVLHQRLPCFRGGLYSQDVALALNEDELTILCAAADRDWSGVEPAIFGGLMEKALSPDERSLLGAHYTPRAYVERLVEATIMDGLREEWTSVQSNAVDAYKNGQAGRARKAVRTYHRRLCEIRVLDPACGTGNFLYVAMELMKALEDEVLSQLDQFGDDQALKKIEKVSVGPRQFLGIEKNAHAAWIAEIVMWVGHLQGHYRRGGGRQPSEPVLEDYKAIQRRDAIVSGGRFDPSDMGSGLGLSDLANVRPTPWPEADFIIGNPPFIAAKDMRRELGGAYVDAVWAISEGRFRSADFVTCWWRRAAEILTQPKSRLRRFGFITTNSVTQTLSRRVLDDHLAGGPPMRLCFAIPDHPWTTGPDSAAVRIAMTVAERGAANGRGRLLTVRSEAPQMEGLSHLTFSEQLGDIGSDLTIGGGMVQARPLKANAMLAYRGMQLMGEGFQIRPQERQALDRLSDEGLAPPVRPYRNGRDLTDRSRGLEVIDLFGWDEDEARRRHPGYVQHLMERVKPSRDANARAAYRDAWWVFGEPRRELRTALEGLPRYIVTVETAKHRWFRFLDAEILPDNRLVCIASDDPFVLGVLSSTVHRAWALAAGSLLEDRPVYAKGACFDRFPFPIVSGIVREDIAVLAEQIDGLRVRVLERNPNLTMTRIYNVLQKLGRGEALSAAEQSIRREGCVDMIGDLHRRLDDRVIDAYGWSRMALSEAAMVEALLALNQERSKVEGAGQVDFLRPDYQRSRVPLEMTAPVLALPETVRVDLPILSNKPDQLASEVVAALRAAGRPSKAQDLAAGFSGCSKRAKEARITRILGVMAAVGVVCKTDQGWFAPNRRP